MVDELISREIAVENNEYQGDLFSFPDETHVMVDLETLGTKPGAAILAIGAVEFDPRNGTFGREFYARVRWGSNKDREIDYDTVRWWLNQDAAARAGITTTQDEVDLNEALRGFERFMMECGGTEKKVRLWSNGAAFDTVILDNAYGYVHSGWDFRSVRDMRTIKDLSGLDPAEVPADNLIPHHALHDAIWQAKYVCYAYHKLGIGMKPWAYRID